MKLRRIAIQVDHMVITTGDLAACLAFYGALGFRAQDAGALRGL